MAWVRIRKTSLTLDQTSSGLPGRPIPPETSEHRFLEVDPAGLEAIESLVAQGQAEGRGEGLLAVQCDGATFALKPDVRPTLRIVPDKTAMIADGVDAVILTITLLRSDGQPNTGFSGVRRDKIPGGFLGGEPRHVQLIFTNGIATKVFRTTQSGEYEVRSNPTFRVETGFTISAYEV
jgi:hypothetical protein